MSYGVLSSLTNVDVMCVNTHKKILNEIGEELIHANELGSEGLRKITPFFNRKSEQNEI